MEQGGFEVAFIFKKYLSLLPQLHMPIKILKKYFPKSKVDEIFPFSYFKVKAIRAFTDEPVSHPSNIHPLIYSSMSFIQMERSSQPRGA